MYAIAKSLRSLDALFHTCEYIRAERPTDEPSRNMLNAASSIFLIEKFCISSPILFFNIRTRSGKGSGFDLLPEGSTGNGTFWVETFRGKANRTSVAGSGISRRPLRV